MARTRTGWAIAGVAAGAVGIAALRREREIRRVSPELRRPFLRFPLPIGRATMPLLRRPAPAVPLRDGVRLEEHEVPGAPGGGARLFWPDERRGAGALLWIHGGGYVIGSAAIDDAWCARVAAGVGVPVVSVEYRLAPEHPFPAALDDCAAALAWLHDRSEEWGIDRDRVVVGGASAGGGLAAAVVQRAHDEGVPVAFQLLVYPMLDDRTVLRRDHDGRGRLVWTPSANRFGWTAYLGHAPAAAEPRAYAAPARREDLRGLPPAWIGVGDLDLFLDEDREYARRLRAAGTPCELVVVPGMYHGADALAGDAPATLGFRDRMAEAVRAAAT